MVGELEPTLHAARSQLKAMQRSIRTCLAVLTDLEERLDEALIDAQSGKGHSDDRTTQGSTNIC